MDDLELLRRYEPVVRYTQGELFLPAPVEEYLHGCTLVTRTGTGRSATTVAEPGTIGTAELALLGREHDGQPLSLQFVQRPLSRREYKEWLRSPERPTFRSSSRFASVGLLSRLIDSTMRLTLLARGRIPGGYAAAAHRQMAAQSTYTYYGHVTRDAGYVVLQYWFLYAMNDWRSTFGGVNDHEADWEQVTLFLIDHGPLSDPEPAWVAFSSHDEVGDDLRRRWDDPDIAFVDGTHPVVYAGAGSHSGCYLPGEYVVSVGLPLPSFVERVRRAFTRVMPWADDDPAGIGVPYIDYRRGDGCSIGPGQELRWSPVAITDDTDWVRDYRGLWGLDTRDPLGGERAPAGPRYDRDGTVRASWRQPVAWAGLDKEAPTESGAADGLRDLRTALVAQQSEAADQLLARRALLRGARAADKADGRDPRHQSRGVAALAAEVEALRQKSARLDEDLESIDRALARPAAGEPVHAHLRHRAVPLHAAEPHRLRDRLLRVWAAASASLLLGISGLLLLLGYPNVVGALLVLVAAMLLVEATLRGHLVQLLVNLAITAVVLVGLWALVAVVLGNFRQGVGILLVLASLYMGWQTIKEGAST